MTREQLLQLLPDFYRALGHGSRDAVRAMVTPDFRHNIAGVPEGFDPWWSMVESLRCGFGTLELGVEGIVVEDTRCAVRISTSGTHTGAFLGHPASGRHFCCSGMDFLRLEGDRIAERWGVFDTLSMLQQLGLYRPGRATG